MGEVICPFDVVRAFYRALNAGDLDALTAGYHAVCVLERVWTGDEGTVAGRDAARTGWAHELASFEGARPGGTRVDVARIAGMEGGWGWVRAEWESAVRSRTNGAVIASAGYTDFWIEDGLIRRQRTIARAMPVGEGSAAASPASPARTGPRPMVGVGAVIVSEGRVVLVKRRHEPLAGQWSLPGGALELGETLEAGVAREALEETGLVVDVGPVVEVFDRILLDEAGLVRFHFVLVDYLCTVRAGTLCAGGDVEDAILVDPTEVEHHGVAEKARVVIDRAMRLR